jgi:prolyl-tRNA editing enzyme YbaK/EbsC (Cys-tRNA(Pro) deacylase)
MPLSKRLRKFLESHQVEFTLTTHAEALTAREVATAEHVPAREVAKTLVVFGDGAYHMILAFNAGTHREVIYMRMADYRRSALPHVASIVREPEAAYGW